MALEAIKMQRRDVINLSATIEQMAANMDGPDYKLAYALKLSLDGLRPELDAIQAAQKPAKAFAAFEEERGQLAAEYAEKGEGGEAKVRAMPEGGSVYVMDREREAEFNQKFAELRETHKEAIDAENARRDGFADFLRGEVEVKVQRFMVKLVPVKKVTAYQMIVLTPLFIDAAEAAGFPAEPVDPEREVA